MRESICAIRSVWKVKRGRVSLEVGKVHEAIPDTAHGSGILFGGGVYTVRICRYCGCAFMELKS